MHTVESSEPSPLSHGILSGRPFTFLDGAPLEERRTRALSLRRGLGALGPNGLPVPADELDALDPEAVALVLEQVRPRPPQPRRAARPAALAGGLSPGAGVGDRGSTRWSTDGRAAILDGCWVATEQREAAAALHDDDEAAAACVGGPSRAGRAGLGGRAHVGCAPARRVRPWARR